MSEHPEAILPLVEYSVAAHRSGLGVVTLGYLPGVPGPTLSEDQARRSITYINLTVTEQSCAQLAALLTQLRGKLAEAKRTHS